MKCWKCKGTGSSNVVKNVYAPSLTGQVLMFPVFERCQVCGGGGHIK